MGALALAPVLGCSSGEGTQPYAAAVDGVWAAAPDVLEPKSPLLMRELVRYATLAPSSHNTQCWRFRLVESIPERRVDILPDFARRCPVVDPDDHHLFVSLGCAAENLVQAALAYGLKGEAALDRDSSAVRVALDPAPAIRSPLFDAIPTRQTTRSEYDGRPLTVADLESIARAAAGPGVQVLLVTERAGMERVLEYIVAGNTAQLGDPAFVAELVHWIRFDEREAVETGDGLFSRCSGNPAMPPWLGRRLLPLALSAKGENDKYARQIRSSAGIAVFSSEVSDAPQWVQVGRAFQRFALQATVLGIRHAHVNQPVEVPALRDELARSLAIGAVRPDLVVRFGRGPEMPRSLRRPVEDVLL